LARRWSPKRKSIITSKFGSSECGRRPKLYMGVTASKCQFFFSQRGVVDENSDCACVRKRPLHSSFLSPSAECCHEKVSRATTSSCLLLMQRTPNSKGIDPPTSNALLQMRWLLLKWCWSRNRDCRYCGSMLLHMFGSAKSKSTK